MCNVINQGSEKRAHWTSAGSTRVGRPAKHPGWQLWTEYIVLNAATVVCWWLGDKSSPFNEATDVPQHSYPSTNTPSSTRVETTMHLRSIPCADACLPKLVNTIRLPLLLSYPNQNMLQRQQSLATTWHLQCTMAEHTFSWWVVSNIWIARLSWEP